jgi:hypothetical protein
MTHNPNSATKTPYAVHLIVGSDTALSVSDAIPYAIDNGTSGHGVTVSNGVVTLPKGDWLVSFTAESGSAFGAQIYVDSAVNTTFPTIESITSTTTKSNLDSTVIPIESTGGTTVELRVDAAITISGESDCLVYGMRY